MTHAFTIGANELNALTENVYKYFYGIKSLHMCRLCTRPFFVLEMGLTSVQCVILPVSFCKVIIQRLAVILGTEISQNKFNQILNDIHN